MENRDDNLRSRAGRLAGSALKYCWTAALWTAAALVIGGICGGIGAGFAKLLQLVTGLRESNGWMIYLLPAAGVVIVGLYRACRMNEDKGTNLVIKSIRAAESDKEAHITILTAPLIFAGTVLTHMFGGSAGREGAALQIGGSVGAWIGKVMRMGEKTVKTFTICGMAAVFSALFGTPVTAAIFSMEVVSVGIMYYSAFLPAIISSLFAAWISRLCGCAPTAFALTSAPQATVWLYVRIALLAAATAAVSIVFIAAMHATGHLAAKWIKNPYLRAAVGGALIIGLTLIVGNGDYNGAGGEIIAQAIEQGKAAPWAFALKIVFTAITLGFGFKGGEIVPAFFCGATFGCAVGPLLGLDPGFSAAVGLIALFCGVVNCPLASLILSAELFGADTLLLFAPVCAVSYVMSGYFGLYSSQNIVYSKLKNEYINKKVG